jgi:hypothetical protein
MRTVFIQRVIRIEFAGIVVSAHQYFCDDARRQKLQSTHNSKKTKKHQGPIANRFTHEFQNTQVSENQKSDACHDTAKSAEEMTWSRTKSQKIMNGQKVKQHAKCSR